MIKYERIVENWGKVQSWSDILKIYLRFKRKKKKKVIYCTLVFISRIWLSRLYEVRNFFMETIWNLSFPIFFVSIFYSRFPLCPVSPIIYLALRKFSSFIDFRRYKLWPSIREHQPSWRFIKSIYIYYVNEVASFRLSFIRIKYIPATLK